MEIIRFILVLLVPGLFAALAYSITGRFRIAANPITAALFDLMIFTIMITGLYFFRDIFTMTLLAAQFECLSFTRNYILLSTLIGILLGVGFGFLSRLFFWMRDRLADSNNTTNITL